MRAFQVACIALAAASASALSSLAESGALGASYYGSDYGLGGASYSTGYTQAPAAISYATGPSYAQTISAGPAYAHTISAPAYTHVAAPAYTHVAAPAYTHVAAPAYAHVAHVAAPTYTQIAAAAPTQVQSHEIHSTSGRQAIRIEETQAGDQVIRVHEAAQAGPQVSQIQVPGEQHHIRVVNHQSGPAEVQRVVQRQPTQVFNVQKPGRPGARIVQVVRSESPNPTVEFVSAGGSNHHVYHANDVNTAQPISSATYSAGPIASSYSSGSVASYSAGPIASYSAGPIASYSAGPIATYSAGLGSTTYGSSYSAPAYTTSYSAPSYSTGHVVHSAPSTISYSGSALRSAGSYGSTAVISKA